MKFCQPKAGNIKSIVGSGRRPEGPHTLFLSPIYLPSVCLLPSSYNFFNKQVSFGHFSGIHRLVDLPEYWVFLEISLEFWENSWVFGQLLGKYCQLRLKMSKNLLLLENLYIKMVKIWQYFKFLWGKFLSFWF